MEKEANNSQANQLLILNDQNKANFNSDINEHLSLIEDNNFVINNEIDLNGDEEKKAINNKNDNNFNLDSNTNSLLGKKTKAYNDLESIQISSVNNNKKNSKMNNINPKNELTKEFATKSTINNEKKIIEEYDYGYSIYLLNEGENGLMEDFLKEKEDISTTSDYYKKI